MTKIEELEQELADTRAGIPFHVHTDSRGERWRCTSPYCERGNNVQDEPKGGPTDTPEERLNYRRSNA